MRHLILNFIILILAVCASSVFAAAQSKSSPVGYWKTLDEASGKPRSIIQIYQDDNQVLMGKVVKIFAVPGKVLHQACVKCKGEKLNQPIVGMVIISGLTAHKNQWGDGKILDPENGKTYSCSLKIGNDGNQLKVKGYVGLPVIGRSQTWERIDVMSANG